ncbi:hypothetical protein SAMD00019534_020380 [Acytostelium subglobosum LB1]|uniref:hypothetical protein n=1 Tax=Acytostelium subglobosum LB1 TaxID=1410327 RepID=UPI000644F6F9|nr:hypothetical protein SAMD00019534_020380 [Acytostelium subglobosum LB1]GAM18863.1 hypothetical protein SAMD00019534_020380 [Acytostelium subglobosum LB1]|eukprot:XP_012758083.1 hypothetical protein SAMD00019534_020380 [Acytostelium subglobosum LB1]
MYSLRYILAAVLIAVAVTNAVDNGLGLTPQMGWNSWNHFGCDINETIIMQMAQAIATNGMAAAGYNYVNVDDCWAYSRDSNGVIQSDPTTFPSGMQYLANYVHSLGLKFGLYTCAGTETCAGRPGSEGYEAIDAQTYASWGVDYLKEDWCNTGNNNPVDLYTTMSKALNATGRPIFFSLCNWGVDNPWAWGPDVGNSWRTTGDINDSWDRFLQILYAQIPIASYSGVGGWNDPDMLEVGNGGMSNLEYTTHFSMWSLLAAPLIAGNDLRSVDAATLAIYTAKEVIAVNQDKLGTQGTLVKSLNQGDQQIWARPLADGSRAVVLFNADDTNTFTIQLNWGDIWLSPNQAMTVRDLWAETDLGQFTGSFTSATIPPHGSVMLRVY